MARRGCSVGGRPAAEGTGWCFETERSRAGLRAPFLQAFGATSSSWNARGGASKSEYVVSRVSEYGMRLGREQSWAINLTFIHLVLAKSI